MWTFTKFGFFSAVCARYETGKQTGKPNPNKLMIRARVKLHLENLIRLFPHIFGKCKINETEGTDYAYRLIVAKKQWVDFVMEVADGIDYDNFKHECHEQPKEVLDNEYVHSLMSVWSVMNRLQPKANQYYRQDPVRRPTGLAEPLAPALKAAGKPNGLPSTMGELGFRQQPLPLGEPTLGSPFDEDDEMEQTLDARFTSDADPLDPWGELADDE